MFCNKCGKEIDNEAVMCVHCGVPVKSESKEKSDKSKAEYMIRAWFGGALGMHDIYAGYKKQGWKKVKIFCGLFGIMILSILVLIVALKLPIETRVNDAIMIGVLIGMFVPLLGIFVLQILSIVESFRIDVDAQGKEFK